MMYARAWIPFLFLFCPFILALPTTTTQSSSNDVQFEDAAISPLSPPSFDTSTLPARRTTRFVQRPPAPLSQHVNKAFTKTRRRMGFFFRRVADAVLAEDQPQQEDFIYLRSLEDPVFMSANKLPALTEPSAGMVEKDREQMVQKTPGVSKELLNFLERELETRSVSDEKCAADNLRDIVQRMARSEDAL